VAVEQDYDQRRPGDDPEWVYWLDEDEVQIMAARCYVELGEGARAIPLLPDDRHGKASQTRDGGYDDGGRSLSLGDHERCGRPRPFAIVHGHVIPR